MNHFVEYVFLHRLLLNRLDLQPRLQTLYGTNVLVRLEFRHYACQRGAQKRHEKKREDQEK